MGEAKVTHRFPCSIVPLLLFSCVPSHNHLLAQISVARTPHGRADSVINLDGTKYFALPEEEHMPVQEFFAGLQGSRSEVTYAQAQNNR
jgi:hypothetical protein